MCPHSRSATPCLTSNPCDHAVCPMYPEALCVANLCDCTPKFIDILTGHDVNCHSGSYM